MIQVEANGRPHPPGRLLPMLVVGNGIIGGMEEYVLSLLRQFRQLNQRALVAAPFIGEFTAALLEEGHPARDLHVFDMSETIDVGALAQMVTFLRARKVSILHTHLLPADVLGAAAAAHAGIPAVSTLHGLIRFKEELLLRDLYGLCYVAVSEAGRASAIACGLAPGAVGKIPNGVDPQRFDAARFDRPALRANLGVAPDQVLVTCVSRLAREKYPEGFIKAAEIAASDPRLVFALVGAGPLDSQMRQMVAASPSGDRIRLLGARRDVAEILAASDIAALTSRSESLPFSILEAMSMQLPVVSHDVGGVGEALENGVEGFLVPFGRTRTFAARILRLAQEPQLRRRMGSAGRAKVLSRFNFRHTAEALLDLYLELTAVVKAAPVPAVPSLTTSGNRRASIVLSPALRTTSVDGAAAAGADASGWRRTRTPPAAKAAHASEISPTFPDGIVDPHLHLRGGETAEDVLGTLDAEEIASACLIGPFLDMQTWAPAAGAALRRANDALLEVTASAPHRLWGLVTVDPREGRIATAQLEEYAANPAVRGVKLIPHGWAPDEAAAFPVYELCEERRLPILFHSGVFISGRAADACRPARYEAVRRFPALKVVLAHLAWPWVDEAIAVALMDPLKGRSPQIYLDLSPGTPPVYRADALRKAYRVLGGGVLLFASDRFLPVEPGWIRKRVREDLGLFRSFGAHAEDLQKIFGGNARELFGTVSPLRRITMAGPISVEAREESAALI